MLRAFLFLFSVIFLAPMTAMARDNCYISAVGDYIFPDGAGTSSAGGSSSGSFTGGFSSSGMSTSGSVLDAGLTLQPALRDAGFGGSGGNITDGSISFNFGGSCDSLDISDRNVVTLEGDYGATQYRPSSLSGAIAFDARQAHWIVDNCGWEGPKNPYPVILDNTSGGSFIGGVFTSRIPQDTVWNSTYCNSAAAVAHRAAPDFTFDSLRIDGAWDGVRFAAKVDSEGLLQNTWLSNGRDDCVENDALETLTIRDTLMDGCFVGISIDPGRGGADNHFNTDTLTLDRVLLRVQSYQFRQKSGEVQTIPGPFIKPHSSSPAIEIHNSIFAFHRTSNLMDNRMARAWQKTTSCSNNLLLWLSDDPFPSSFPTPPSCFRIVTGAEARGIWESAKSDWINRHPDVGRVPGDPPSDPSKCTQ